MGLGKWIGGVLGFMAAGPLGALAGIALGSLFDSNDLIAEPQDSMFGTQHRGGSSSAADSGQRNSFLFSLLVMASYIMKADGRVMHSEMEYVRQFLRTNFGESAVIQGEQILRNLFEQRRQMEARNPMAFRTTIADCGEQIAQNMSYEQRLQLLSFLANIARADGSLPQVEIDALKEVAAAMRLTPREVDSLLNLGGNTLDEAYKVLEVDPSATDEEVRKAYRRLALKHHPDKVEALGDDVKKAAEEKFQQINQAKEIIYKARGLK